MESPEEGRRGVKGFGVVVRGTKETGKSWCSRNLRRNEGKRNKNERSWRSGRMRRRRRFGGRRERCGEEEGWEEEDEEEGEEEEEENIEADPGHLALRGYSIYNLDLAIFSSRGPQEKEGRRGESLRARREGREKKGRGYGLVRGSAKGDKWGRTNAGSTKGEQAEM
ncbi:hypothetical protein KM043_016731 [Ampulex compressa]|nr:hypothetical protein KM043_016731 [Ampulex compressa]